MIDIPVLNQLILDAFTGKTTWFEAGNKYSLADFIDSFRRTRAAMQKTIIDISDAQAAYHAEGNPAWSLSETVTHLVYSQNFYYNQLVDSATSDMPHIVEAAKGFGEGAKRNVPAAELRSMLDKATVIIYDAIDKTRINYRPTQLSSHPFFGKVGYQTWILLLLAHEVDHVRQAIVMRRLARAATNR